MQKLDKFTEAYVYCAMWSSIDENGESIDQNRDISDFAPETIEAMSKDCQEFQEKYAMWMVDLDADQCGHDFWLTRNHHGVGFWDRGYGDIGDRLTEAAHSYREVNLYVGDDGKIYIYQE